MSKDSDGNVVKRMCSGRRSSSIKKMRKDRSQLVNQEV